MTLLSLLEPCLASTARRYNREKSLLTRRRVRTHLRQRGSERRERIDSRKYFTSQM